MPQSPYQRHVAKWSQCTACPLCEQRKHVVLARGKLPADVLFIGEAPGQSEDVLGMPFAGPAGHLLDEIIEDALRHSDLQGRPRLAFTNLVACIPKDDSGSKIGEPSAESIAACEQRLIEIVNIAKPFTIVRVGKLSHKYVSGQGMFGECRWASITDPGYIRFTDIVHPAAILRADVTQQGLLIQRCRSTLSDMFDELTLRS